MSGRVVSYGSGQPIANARITPEAGAAVVSDAAGTFRIGSETNPPYTPYRVTVEADGHVTREARLNWQRGLREGVTVDLMALQPPFSLDLYRQLVRNTFEAPAGLEPLRRLTENPSFYIKTTDDRGHELDPDAIAALVSTVPVAVQAFSGGRLSVARLERGPGERPDTPGWVNVVIVRELEDRVCGRARIGAEAGLITLAYDRCTCNSRSRINSAVVWHEVGHAMGFWHVGQRDAIMTRELERCMAEQITPAESFHAALAYQRPVGSRDPDIDPNNIGFVRAPGGRDVEVSCGLP